MASKRDTEQDVPAAGVGWLKKLAQELNVPYAPGGWHTVAEISEVLSVDHQTVRRILSKRKAKGQIFKTVAKDGKVLKITHYKL